MSLAISRLHLEQPPATVHRVGSRFALLWRVQCGECGRKTKPRRLISAGLADQAEHARIHAFDARVADKEREALESRAFHAARTGEHVPIRRKKLAVA